MYRGHHSVGIFKLSVYLCFVLISLVVVQPCSLTCLGSLSVLCPFRRRFCQLLSGIYSIDPKT